MKGYWRRRRRRPPALDAHARIPTPPRLLQPGSLTGLVALLLLAVLAAAADGALRQEDAADAAPDCPCDDRELCRPVTTKHSLEFLGFTLYNETKSDKSR